MLKGLKQIILSGYGSKNLIVDGDLHLNVGGQPIRIIDKTIEEEVERIRKGRYFFDFESSRAASRLGTELLDGELSGGSPVTRGWAAAWCSRVLAYAEDRLEQAESLAELSQKLGEFPETTIALAFISSANGNRSKALATLANTDLKMTRTARFLIIAHHDGPEAALDWLDKAHFPPESLDSDGKFILLSRQLEFERWAGAFNTVENVSQSDFQESPILYGAVGLTNLVIAVPEDLRSNVLQYIPFFSNDFPLSADPVAMDARNKARNYFVKAAEVARTLGFEKSARINDEYALWMELRDPSLTQSGIQKLEQKLRDPSSFLGYIRYGIQYGLKIDFERVEQEIDQCFLRNGHLTQDAALARYTLAFTQPTPSDSAAYLAQHQKQLAAHIDIEMIQAHQLSMYAQAGLIDQALQVIENLQKSGLPEEREKYLRSIIDEAMGTSPIKIHRSHYEESGDLSDLIALVSTLEEEEQWSSLATFGTELFDRTKSLAHAEKLAMALNKTQDSTKLINFIETNKNLLIQSDDLRMSYAWGLYYGGELVNAKNQLTKLEKRKKDVNYRSLMTNLAISSGDWSSLDGYIYAEYLEGKNRSPEELLAVAQLALSTNSKHTKSIVLEAVKKCSDDKNILATAYFIATKSGWENDPVVSQWLHEAAANAGEGGPLKSIGIRELIEEQLPDWERHESEISRLLTNGEIPMFLAGKSVNRSLMDISIIPALRNLREKDPRRRVPIGAYAGNRSIVRHELRGKKVAVDPTALLTLSFLGIIDQIFEVFRMVVIPHSTLTWLFEEKQKTAFHQPSRIAEATKVRAYMATGAIENFASTTVASSDLADQIGAELALLLAETQVRKETEEQSVVIHSPPVYRISSLMEEEADLSEYTSVLYDCHAVVKKLRQKGQVTEEEEKRALAYLDLREKTWTNRPEIPDGSTLYLSGSSLSYLIHLQLVEKLQAAGLDAVVPPSTVLEVDNLLAYDQISEDTLDVIEGLRSVLQSGITTNRVSVGRFREHGHLDDLKGHPTVDIVSLAEECDLAIVDDRFINRHARLDFGSGTAPMLSVLDIIASLVDGGDLCKEAGRECTIKLRQAGYFFIPIECEDVVMSLRGSKVVQGKVVETAELKSMRESLLLTRMRQAPLAQEEVSWLIAIFASLREGLEKIWSDDEQAEICAARSDWILEQLDIRGWLRGCSGKGGVMATDCGRVSFLASLLHPPESIAPSLREHYTNWLQETVLRPLRVDSPREFDQLLQLVKDGLGRLDFPPAQGGVFCG